MDDSVQAFWDAFERDTGEKVSARTMGQYLPAESGAKPLWGLLVLTDSSLRFRPTPGENWFAGLFKNTPSVVSNRQEDDIRIPLEAILQISSPRKSLVDRIFGTSMDSFELRIDRAGREECLKFLLDPRNEVTPRLPQKKQ
jgi:hypothetical protein